MLIKVKKVNSEDNSIVVVVSDISRMKELEKIEKRVMSIFFQTITHKLNTPLNQVMPFVGLLIENLKDEESENFQMMKMIENGIFKLKH